MPYKIPPQPAQSMRIDRSRNGQRSAKMKKLGGMKIEEIFNEKFIDILEYIMLL
jgi:hypothetical protein